MKVNKHMNSATKNTIKTIMSRVLVVLLSYAMVSSTSPVGYVAAYGLDEATDQAAQTEQATTDQTTEAAPTESTQTAPAESTQSTTTQQSTQQSTQQAATEQTIALNLGNGYITYYGQTIAAPTSSLTVPTDRDFTFAAAANGGYTLKAVYRTMGESETPIAANSDGTYTLHASDFAAGVGIRIDAEATSTESASTTSLTSAADALNQVLADSTETVYTYEDEHVSVKATLSDPHAVPDDAQFVVTQVTPDTKDADGNPAYNYDAYMDALNGGKTTDDSTYTADNTLLYDVAFMYPELGDDGQPTGKTVEFEPAAGTVKIEITYKQNQLTNAANGSEEANADVLHLPLSDSVRDDVDSTAAAIGISASDVKVENVDADANVAHESVSLTVSDLSVFAVKVNDNSEFNMKLQLNFTDADGNAKSDASLGNTQYPGPYYAVVKIAANSQVQLWQDIYAFVQVPEPNGKSSTSIDLTSASFVDGNGNKLQGQNGKAFTLPAGEYSADVWLYTKAAGKGNVSFNDARGKDQNNGNVVIENGTKLGFNTFSFPPNTTVKSGDTYTITVANSFQDATHDYDYASILGEAVNYGITCANFIDIGHSQTNVATKDFANQAGTILQPNLSGNSTGKFLIGHVSEGTLWAGDTAKPVPIYINENETDKVNTSNGAVVIPMPGAVINAQIDNMISHMQSVSNDMIGKHTDVPTVERDGKVYFDTTAYSDNATIYIDGDKYASYLAGQQAAVVNMRENQTIVFNYKSADVTVGAVKLVKVDDKGNTTDLTDFDVISRHVIFNLNKATSVQVGTQGSGAAILVANANSHLKPKTQSNGWILSAGTVEFGGAEWHNVYGNMPSTATATLKANKTVDGKKATSDQKFTFKLERWDGSKWVSVDQQTNNSGQVTFMDVDLVGKDNGTVTNVFRITETGKDDSTTGNYNIDKSVYYATVDYTTVGSGDSANRFASDPRYFTSFDTSTMQGTAATGNAITFTNSTQQNNVGSLKVKKVFSDTSDLDASNLTDAQKQAIVFTVTGPDGYRTTFTYADMSNGEKTLENLKPGDYTVSETIGDIAGYKATYTVSNDGRVTVAKNQTPEVTVTNTYTKKTGTVTFGGTKSYDGQLSAGLFSFTATLVKQDGKSVSNGVSYPASVKADGTFAFPEISYDTTGTYIYKVTEDKGGTTQDGIVYDGSAYYVTVKVAEGADKLETAVSVTDADGKVVDGVTFTNKQYTATGSVTFKGTKSIDGRAMTSDDIYTFVVKDNQTGQTWEVKNDDKGKIKYPKIEYTLATLGTHTYTVTEKTTGKEPAGITNSEQSYTVTVTVKDDVKDGQLEITTSDNAKALDFKNTYTATGSLTLSGTKTLENQGLNETTAQLFTYEVLEVDADGNTIKTVQRPVTTNAADGSINFQAISYTLSDVGTHHYVVREIIPEGSEETETGSNIWKSGSYLYDGHNYTFDVTVSDNGDGTLKVERSGDDPAALNFTNTYKASGSVVLTANKVLTGRDLKKGEFTFELKDADGNVLQTVTNDANSNNGAHGLVTFSEIAYTKSDLEQAVKDHKATKNADGSYTVTYTIDEVAGNDSHITYATNTVHVTVTIVDNGSGKLTATADYGTAGNTFTNKYSASGYIDLTGHKTLQNKTLDATTAQLFTYTVKDEAGKTVSTGSTAADGTITFTRISYTLADLGTHTYTVTEDNGGNTSNGIQYDGKSYQIEVTVSDNGDGTLSAVRTDNAGDINFTNTYSATGSVTFSGTKTMEGRALNAGDVYTFSVKESDTEVATGQSDASGKITFTPIQYVKNGEKDQTGEHTYTITETTPNQNGVTAKTKSVTVKVTVTDDGNGNLSVAKTEGDYEALSFVNTYTATNSLTLSGKKTLEHKDLDATTAQLFTYTVVENENGEPTGRTFSGTTDAEGNITFDSIDYALANAGHTYTYTVSENHHGEKIDGIKYSDKTYNFTVSVSDKGDGTLKLEKSGDDTNHLDFTNTYTAKGKVQFAGTKTMEGRSLADTDVFEFTISEGNKVVATATNTGKKINYPVINYTLDDVGKHTYTVAETAHNVAGVTTDTNTYTVTVSVTDNGDGTLKVETSGDDSQKLDFTNTYATSASIEIAGTKQITGRKFADGDSYTFTIEGSTGAPMPANTSITITPTSGSSAAFSFGAINYTQADNGKTYTYTVKEQAGNIGGITYDDAVKTVTVKVSDDGKGNLKAEVVNSKSDKLVFKNEYHTQNTSVSFGGTKMLEGRKLKAGEFTFQLVEDGKQLQTVTNAADGSFSFDSITYTKPGTHNYTVSEVIPDDAKNADGVTYAQATAEQKAAGGFTYKGVTYTNASYNIQVKVTDDGQGHLVKTVTGVDDPTNLSFTNKYDASGSITLEGTKKYEGQTDGQFSFTATDENGKVYHGTNAADGAITFEPIEYTLADAGKTFTYTVAEVAGDTDATGITYDDTTYTVKVKVTDNGDGTLKAEVTKDSSKIKFTNTYDASGLLELSGTKTYEGQTEGQFTFTVKDADGKTVSTGKNKADGTIEFTPIHYNLRDAGKSYTYTVSEDHGGQTIAGITYDGTTYTFIATISDANHNGQLTVTTTGDNPKSLNFTNTYNATGSVTLKGTKTYEGDKTGFTFTAVEQEDGVSTGRTFNGTTDKVGNITFGEISYTLANVGHTYTYTVTEDVPAQAKNSDGVAYADATAEQRAAGGFVYNGITYSNAVQTVTVEVKDDVKDGKLEVTPSANYQALAFTNTYGAKGFITLEGTKTLTGRAMAAGEFTFQVKEGDNFVVTGHNDASGHITFDAINYTGAGEHDYTVSEVTPTQGGVTAGGQSYNIHVSVIDNGDGTLTATRTDNAGSLAFTNTYTATGDVTFHGTKSFDTRTVRSSDTFTFNIDETTEGVANPYHGTATSKGGTINYPKISYTLADVGTHTYHVTEADTTAGGVTASEQSYDVTVTVADSDAHEGTLKITTSDNADALNFTNTYTAKGQTTLTGTKTLTGRNMAEGEFGFTVKDASGVTVATGTNDAATDGQAGAIIFTPITYTQADMVDTNGNYVSAKDFTYTVQENAGTKGGVAYSAQSFTAKVHVVDNGDGTLTATPSYPDGDIAFTNTYAHQGTQVTLGGHKYVENKNEANADKTFTFQLTETTEGVAAADRVSQTVTRTGAGDYSFAPISYTEPGVHTYEIKETAGSDHGYTYDTKVYHVTVSVEDNGQGELVATATDTDTGAAFVTNSADFTNTYQAEATDLQLGAVKNLTGREWKDTDNFTFQLTAVDNAPMPAEGGETATAATTGTHEAAFGSIHYTAAGTYQYKISELAPTGEGVVDNGDGTYTLNGVTYDTNAVSLVTMTVTDNDGQLVATPTYDGKADLPVFTNTYSAGKTTATLEATKQLNGGDIADFDGQFSFTLTAGDNDANVTTPMPEAAGEESTLTVTNAGYAVSFGDINYETSGTYNYTITEVQGDQGGVTYDKTEHTAQVVVADDGNGALHATVTYDGVAATDDTPSPAPVFTNTYFAAKASIAADKHYFGAGDGTFEFTLTKTDARWNALSDDTGATVTYGADSQVVDEGQPFQVVVNNGAYENGVAKVAFPDITYYKAGTYYYKLAETSKDATDASVYLVTVTVDDSQQAMVTYQAVRDGQEAAEATTTDAAVFYNNGYVAVKGAARRARAANAVDGSVNVMPVVQKELVKTTADGETTDATLKEGEFTFQLTGVDGTNVTATNNADGVVAFAQKKSADENIEITNPDGTRNDESGVLTFYAPGTYTYTIKEVAGEDQLISYDDSTITLTVEVTRNSSGKLEATTSYEGATKTTEDGTPVFVNKQKTIVLRTKKTSKVTGDPLPGATYGLWMVNEGGEDVYLGNAVSNGDGIIAFEDFNPEEGKKYYFKEEAAPAGHLVNPYRDVYMIFKRTDKGYDILYEGTEAYNEYVASEGKGE